MKFAPVSTTIAPGQLTADGAALGQVLAWDGSKWCPTTLESGVHSSTFTYEQATSASTWRIIHNLGCFPVVVIADSAGDVVEGDVRFLSPNEVELNFSAPFSGVAYLR